MKKNLLLPTLTFTAVTLLSGCNTLLESVTISKDEVIKISNEQCQYMDQHSQIAGANSKYTKRLNKIAKNLGSTTESGLALNYKVYITDDINAWAMANGCVRVYSGLMDIMSDDEVQGVVGHEIGHVELGHSTKALQTQMATKLARQALVTYGGDKVSSIAQSYGDLAESVINSQFSQSQESDADNYSFDLLKSKRLNTVALATSFDKLASESGNSNFVSQIFSSHPDTKSRANNIRNRIAKEGQ